MQNAGDEYACLWMCFVCVFVCILVYSSVVVSCISKNVHICVCVYVCVCAHMYMCADLQTVRDFSKGVSHCDDGEGGPFVFSHSATRTLSHMWVHRADSWGPVFPCPPSHILIPNPPSIPPSPRLALLTDGSCPMKQRHKHGYGPGHLSAVTSSSQSFCWW